MMVKYIGEYPKVKLYTFPEYEFIKDEWTKVSEEDGALIIKNYKDFVKESLKEGVKDGVSNIQE